MKHAEKTGMRRGRLIILTKIRILVISREPIELASLAWWKEPIEGMKVTEASGEERGRG